jgi:methylthioribose-1-phosphate isomerase
VKVADVSYRSVWRDGDNVGIIDQTSLPYEFRRLSLETCEAVAHAIKSMQVRGAPLIGAVAAYGLALALRKSSTNDALSSAAELLMNTRPTAVNLRWALTRMLKVLGPLEPAARVDAAWAEAGCIADEDVELNRSIGRHGLNVIRDAAILNSTVNILTHCNAGWLATVDYGTALAPVYLAHDEGISVHVWVDETRPRNQGFLTAWELGSHGVPYTLIADNAGGHLMQKGKVDLVLVGADRVTRDGHVCNKIGTYLKALAAHANNVPFYAAVPSPTIDWTIEDPLSEIPIEERSADEIRFVHGLNSRKQLSHVAVGPEAANVSNPAFDITPPALVSGIITEAGIVAASREGLNTVRGAASTGN